jgi:hypothetical protein
MREGGRVRLAMFAVAMVAVLTAGGACASGSAAFRVGRESTSAQQLVFDEALVKLKGETGAVAALVGSGVPQAEAQRRVLAAVVAMAGGGR